MTDIATRTPQQELVAQIRADDSQQQIAAALEGSGIAPAKFVRVAVTAINENPELVKAERPSLFSALMRCAQDGLLPDGREAALVMFGKKATYMPMIGGFRKIAAEHGWSLRTAVVYENDDFQTELGLEPRLVHHPVRPGRERGEPIAAYAVARHRDGRLEFEVMTKAEIEKVRESSRAKDSGPWRDWWERMWEKTAGRRLFAKLPIAEDDRIERVMAADNGDPISAIYGADAASAAAALGPGTAAPSLPPQESTEPHLSSPPSTGGPDREAGPAGSPSDEPPLEGEIVDEEIDGSIVIPPGFEASGDTLDAVLAAPAGADWLTWAAKNLDRFPEDFRAPLAAFVNARIEAA